MSRGRQRAPATAPADGFEAIRANVKRMIAPILRQRAGALDQSEHVDELVGAARLYLMAGDQEACQAALERAHHEALGKARAASIGNMIDRYGDQARTIERWRDDLSQLIPDFLVGTLHEEAGYQGRLHAEVSRALGMLIGAGDRRRAIAMFEDYRRDWERSPGPPATAQDFALFDEHDDDAWTRARIIARAEAHLGEPHRFWATGGPGVSAQELSEARALLAGGDRAERDGGDHLFGDLSLDEQRSRPATSGAQVLSFVRAMLRWPARYLPRDDDYGEKELIAEVLVDEAALRDLLRGRPEVLYGAPGAPAGTTLVVRTINEGAATLTSRSLSVSLRPIRGGRRVILPQLNVDLGTDEQRAFRRIAELEEIGLGAVSITLQASQPPAHLKLRSAIGHNTRRGRIDVVELLGPESCAHPRGDWRPSRAGGTIPGAAALRLSCPDCLRERAALIPAHRLPADHPLRMQIDALPYLAAERYRRVLAGQDPSLVPDSLEVLCAREPVVSLDPADWASGEVARARSAGEDIAQALGRRRRR